MADSYLSRLVEELDRGEQKLAEAIAVLTREFLWGGPAGQSEGPPQSQHQRLGISADREPYS
jgi:hypothetical protein